MCLYMHRCRRCCRLQLSASQLLPQLAGCVVHCVPVIAHTSAVVSPGAGVPFRAVCMYSTGLHRQLQLIMQEHCAAEAFIVNTCSGTGRQQLPCQQLICKLCCSSVGGPLARVVLNTQCGIVPWEWLARAVPMSGT